MNCLDCGQDLATVRPAEAVCLGCGAAVCSFHAVISLSRRPVGPGSGQPSTSDTPSRSITCLVCAQAVQGSVAAQAIRALRARYRVRRR